MGSISVSNGAFTHTVSAPGRHPNTMAKTRLRIVTLKGRTVFSVQPSSSSEGTASYSGTIPADDLRRLADCSNCSWLNGRYAVVVDDGQLIGSETLETGSVTFSGALPCSDCGGTDPPPPDPPPGGGSGGGDPYGPSTDWDPGVDPPPAPPDPCLPPPFTQPSAPVPDPCGGGGSGGSGAGGFANPTP